MDVPCKAVLFDGRSGCEKHQIPVSYRLRSAETKRLLETETAEQFVEFVRQTAYFRGKQAVLEPEDELTWERVMIRTYEKYAKASNVRGTGSALSV